MHCYTWCINTYRDGCRPSCNFWNDLRMKLDPLNTTRCGVDTRGKFYCGRHFAVMPPALTQPPVFFVNIATSLIPKLSVHSNSLQYSS